MGLSLRAVAVAAALLGPSAALAQAVPNLAAQGVALVSGGVAGAAARVQVTVSAAAPVRARIEFFASATGAFAGATSVGSGIVDLAVGENRPEFDLTLPGTLDGAYFLATRVAADSGRADTNPLDDTLVAPTRTRILAPSAQLAVDSVRVTTRSVHPGDPASVDVRVSNRGQRDASVRLLVVASRHDAPSAADPELASGVISLVAGQSRTVTLAGLAPATLSPGDYRVAAIADPELSLSERDLTDNVALSPDTLSVFVDQLTWATPSLPAGTVFIPYALKLEAQGGDGFYRFNVLRGQLPAGLRLDAATGLLAGTPLQSGSFELTLEVRSNGLAANLQTRLEVVQSGVGLIVATQAMPQGTLGLGYETTLVAAGGEPPYSFVLVAGALPAGLDLAGDGRIGGIPSKEGGSSFTVEARDALGARVRVDLDIEVRSPNIVLLSTNPPALPVGESVQLPLSVSGGKPPYKWQALSAPPPGLTLTEEGQLSGTPTLVGRYVMRARVTESSRNTLVDTALVFLEVRDAGTFEIVKPEIPRLALRERLDITFDVTGGTAPFAWRVSRGSELPRGFSYEAKGASGLRLYGFSIRPIEAPLQLEVTDAAGRTRQVLFGLSVDPAVRLDNGGGGCSTTSGTSLSPLVALVFLGARRRRIRR